MVRCTKSVKFADRPDSPAEFLKNMSASADVLAMAKVEVDLAAIPEGKNVSISRRPGLTKPWLHDSIARLTGYFPLLLGHYQVARKARLHPTPNG
jgi:hypothetical protein